MKKSFLTIDSFHLKVLALFFMAVDHFGVIFYEGTPSLISYEFYVVLRTLGRIAFPLFAFMIAEGMFHTKRSLRYLSRLSAMLVFMGVAIFVVSKLMGFSVVGGNIFIDLTLGALTIYFLKQKNWIKPVAILPLAFLLLSIHFKFPLYARSDYRLYGYLMIVGFYLTRVLSTFILKYHVQKAAIDFEGYKLTNEFQRQLNIYSSIWLLTINLIWYIIAVASELPIQIAMSAQAYSIIAIPIIYLYSGRLGYRALWFKYGSYAFYPLHFLILYGIYMLATIIN
jgi:hypothetical protein